MRESVMLDKTKEKHGLVIFITGLSGSGKTTIANLLAKELEGNRNRKVTVLDGDVVRKHLSQELGFSKEHRNINVDRVGFVAGEITKHGGITICALIAPYESSREKNRKLLSKYGGYVEVYLSTPLDVCEKRDTKGLYKKARQGLIEYFTGITDPYEAPENSEVTIDTSKLSPEMSVETVMNYLRQKGHVD